MKPAKIKLLSGVALLLWLFLLMGKRLAPEWLGGSAVQWSGIIVFTVIASIGFLVSLRAFFSVSTARLAVGIYALAFLGMFLFNVGLQGVSGIYFAMTYMRFYELSSARMLDTQLNALASARTEEEKQGRARFIYTVAGLSLPYQRDDGSFVTYQPTGRDAELLAANSKTDEELNQVVTLAHNQFSQIFWLIIIQVCIFFLTHVLGLAYFGRIRQP